VAKEAVKKAAKEAADEVNWAEYFTSIKSVCPWSRAYWSKQKIDIVDWTGTVYPLNGFVARVYKAPQLTAKELYNKMRRFNKLYDAEEWLYSHPKFKGHSTPIPVMIQQDYDVLARARAQHKYKKQL
jgi:hypothetical protein